MSLPRRQFLRLAAATTFVPALSSAGKAATYPSHPVRIVVGFAAGSGADILARLIGQWLSERLGQPFVIENRAGAGTNIATESLIRAPADGHTLLLVTPANVINANLYPRLNFNFIDDIAPVASLANTPNVLLVNPSVPAHSVPEFIAYARAHPYQLSMASAGTGSASHMSGELFKLKAGVDLLHVPYRGGGPALNDLLGGHVQLMFPTLTASLEYIKAGSLRALAVTTATRSEVLPDVTTVGEFVPGYESSTTDGIGAPKGTPPGIIEVLNREINAGLNDPKIRAQLAGFGSMVLAGTSADFASLIASETEKWTSVIGVGNIKVD